MYGNWELNPDREFRRLIFCPLNYSHSQVRVTGLEPATHGLKVHYLTTWLHAQDIMFKSPMFSFHNYHSLSTFQGHTTSRLSGNSISRLHTGQVTE